MDKHVESLFFVTTLFLKINNPRIKGMQFFPIVTIGRLWSYQTENPHSEGSASLVRCTSSSISVTSSTNILNQYTFFIQISFPFLEF